MQTHVHLEFDDDIATIAFECDVPGKPTTLDAVVLDELEGALETIETLLGTLRVVLVKSQSPKYFLVGANINALKTLNPDTISAWVKRGHTVFNRLEALPLPVIALVKGYALGGGLELAMACDLILAGHNAKFGQPEAKLGLVSGWGGSFRLPRRIGLTQAKRLFFSGDIIDAERALDLGLVASVGDVTAELDTLLDGIRSCSPVAVAQMKELLSHSQMRGLHQNADDEARASVVCLDHPDTQKRVQTYLESRKK